MWSNDIKCKYMFMFSLKNLARKGLRSRESAWFGVRIIQPPLDLTVISTPLLPKHLWNVKAKQKFKLTISPLRDVMKSYDTTFHLTLKRALAHLVVLHTTWVSICTRHGVLALTVPVQVHGPLSSYDISSHRKSVGQWEKTLHTCM